MRLFNTASFFIAALIALYLYTRLRLALRTFGADTGKKRIQLLLIVVSALLGAAATNIRNTSALLVLHFTGLCFALQCANALLPKGWRCPLWRKIYSCGLVPLVLTMALMGYGYYNMHHVVPTFYTVQTGKNIRPEGYRVALIADVHFGVSLDEEKLRAVCADISAQKPDIVALCGDIIDNSATRDGMEQVFAALGSIKSTYGNYYVYGNHDRPGERSTLPFTRSDLTAAIEKNGIIILQDKTLAVTDDLLLAGREDRGYSRNSSRLPVDQLLSGADRNDFILLLDHQPHEYALCGEAGADLLLSGHTHGGQLWPIGQVQKLLNSNDWVYGLTRVDEDTQAIVTSGLAGWAYPFKTAAPAEYVIIDILPAQRHKKSAFRSKIGKRFFIFNATAPQ